MRFYIFLRIHEFQKVCYLLKIIYDYLGTPSIIFLSIVLVTENV